MAEVDGPSPAGDNAPPDFQPTAPPKDSSPRPTQDITNPNLTPPSLIDNGLSRRPRDARLIHMILANYGVTAYQERVPLQLMDFAYRYTSSTLQDALHFTSEGYGTTGPGGGAKGAHNDLNSITLSALRLSISSRTHYQFNSTLPKEVYSELAQERNRVALPPLQKEWGIRLPPEQYCLTGKGLEWDMMELEDGEGDGDATMPDVEREDDDEDEVEGGRMEDIFGEGNGEGDDDGMQEE